MNGCGQQIALGIDDHLAFATLDLFAAVEATLATSLRGLDRLTVNYNRCRFCLAALVLAHTPAQLVVYLEQCAIVVPFIEVVAHRARWWKVERDHRPLTAC